MATIDLTSANFQKEISTQGLVMIDFWASWCGPCMMQAPIVEELSDQTPNVKFCKVNVDEEPELAAEYKVRSIPTLVFLKGGEPVEMVVGLHDKEALLSIIERNM